MTTNGQQQQRFKPIFKICLICVAVLIVGGGFWVRQGISKKRVVPKRFGVVDEGQLYRSGIIPSALVKDVLIKYNIKVVIDLAAGSPEGNDRKAEKQAVAELGIERLTFFSLDGDGTGDVNDYVRAIAAIAKAKQGHKPVLVHCNAGRRRTGGVIAAYQLLVEEKVPSLVYREFTRYNRDKDLINYVNSHMEEMAVLLKQMGVISEVPSPLPVLGP